MLLLMLLSLLLLGKSLSVRVLMTFCVLGVEGMFVVFRSFFVKVGLANFTVGVVKLVDVVLLGVEKVFPKFES